MTVEIIDRRSILKGLSGYMGPRGKAIRPHRAVAKLEMRLAPNMTKEDTLAKLRAHLDKHGFRDVPVNVTGAYGPGLRLANPSSHGALVMDRVCMHQMSTSWSRARIPG